MVIVALTVDFIVTAVAMEVPSYSPDGIDVTIIVVAETTKLEIFVIFTDENLAQFRQLSRTPNQPEIFSKITILSVLTRIYNNG